MKNANLHYGFTLIETIVTVAVFGILGTIALAILVNSTRLAGKSNNLTIVRENGDYAISIMAKNIRMATSLQKPSISICSNNPSNPPSNIPGDLIQLGMGDGTSLIYDCQPPSNKLASVSAASIPQVSTSLIDTTTVKVISCKFTCSVSPSGGSPVIDISFSLQTNNGTSLLPETFLNPIQFQDSILMRNVTSY